jgi:hypothetical protein
MIIREHMFYMEVHQLPLHKANGSITGAGILINGVTYTCQQAIREQWFERAQCAGPIAVEVYIDPSDLSGVVLLLSVGFVYCNQVQHEPISAEEYDHYFKKMRSIRAAIKQRKEST